MKYWILSNNKSPQQ